MAKKKKEKTFSSFLNNPIDFTLVITILLLLGIGLVMVLSASSPSVVTVMPIFQNSCYLQF